MAIGGAVYGGVVDNHQVAICAQVDIELDGVNTLFDSQPKSCQGVLRSISRGTSVSNSNYLVSMQAFYLVPNVRDSSLTSFAAAAAVIPAGSNFGATSTRSTATTLRSCSE